MLVASKYVSNLKACQRVTKSQEEWKLLRNWSNEHVKRIQKNSVVCYYTQFPTSNLTALLSARTRSHVLPREEELDIGKSLQKFDRALRITHEVFHPAKVRRHRRSSAYKTTARPILTYRSEVWTIRKQDELRLTTAEMKCKTTVGYSLLGSMRNEHILDKMKVTPITECVNNYRQNGYDT
jgi:hypothetical protein